MEGLNMSLGETIRNVRKSKGFSIMKIKELTGLSKSTISDLENDKSSPTADTLQKIATALGVPVEDFFKEYEPIISKEADDKSIENETINPKLKPIIDSLDRAGDLQDEDIEEIGKQVEFLINLKRKKKSNS